MPLNDMKTHSEYLGEGGWVTVQYCDFEKKDGTTCNVYLGVNYPSMFCPEHRPPN